jgi:glycosyltransferase involved in cell wall biosynthesis
MKLAVILPTLAGGGMERMRLHLIEEWIKSGVEVDLLVSSCKGELFEMVPDSVKIFELSSRSPYFFPLGLYRYMKNENPTHILTCGHDINGITLFMACLLRKNIPIVGSFHNHLSSELSLAKGLKKAKLIASILLLRIFLWKSQGIISVSQGVSDDLKKYLGSKYNIFHVVYNPVITPTTLKKINEPLKNLPVPEDTPWILYAGRFVHAKGLDILLKAFKMLAKKSSAHLVLMGEGPLKAKIMNEAKSAGFDDRIHLLGFQSNPLPWIRKANALVLPSRHEGLGNVIIEGLACGTQIVATDCPSGPAEILENGNFGQLVPVEDPFKLSDALFEVLNEETKILKKNLVSRSNFFKSGRSAMMYENILKGSKPGL